MPKFEQRLSVVEAWRTNRDRRVETSEGIKTAHPGQWLVVVADGVYAILNDDAFRAAYKAKDKAAEKALDAPIKTMERLAEEQQERADADAAEAADRRRADEKREGKEREKKEKEDKKQADAEAKAKAKEEGKGKSLLARVKAVLSGGGETGDQFLESVKELIADAKELSKDGELDGVIAAAEKSLELGPDEMATACRALTAAMEKVKAGEDK